MASVISPLPEEEDFFSLEILTELDEISMVAEAGFSYSKLRDFSVRSLPVTMGRAMAAR